MSKQFNPLVKYGFDESGTAANGVPTGGTTGQVLAKNSGTDYDTEWVDQTGGSSIFVTVGASDADYITDGTADDVQIQEAIDAVETAGGGIVHIKKGTYNLAATLDVALDKGLTIEGTGWETILKINNSVNAYAITFNPTSSGIWCHFRDFKIECNGANQTAGGGIYAKGTLESIFENLWINQPYENGIYFHEISSGNIGHNNRVINCHFDSGADCAGNGRGIYFHANDENQVINCDFQGMGGAGGEPYAIKDESGLTSILGNTFVSGKHCIKLQNATRTRIIGNAFDGGFHQVYASADECVISNNNFYLTGDAGTANAYSAVYIDFGGNNVISNNVFESHSTNGQTRSFIRDNGDGANIIEGNQFKINGTIGTANIEDTGTADNIVIANEGYDTNFVSGTLRTDAMLTGNSIVKNQYTGNLVFRYSKAYYKLDETSGTAVADSQASYDFTASGATIVDGKLTKARSFNGTSDYLTNSDQLLTVAQNFSIQAWVYLDNTTGEQTVFYIGSDGGGMGIVINHTSAGSVDVLFGGVAWFYSGSTISTGAWHHIVVTRDTTTTKIYVDGSQTANTSTSTPVDPIALNSIGMEYAGDGSTPQRYFKGYIDEVGLWTSVLTAGNVTTLYNAGAGLAFDKYIAAGTNLEEWQASDGTALAVVDSDGNIGIGNSTPTQKLDVTGNIKATDVLVTDEAYGAGWNASLEVPTKNAVYDKIETITGASGIANVVEDTTPQLGGNLDLNTFTAGDATAADLTKLHALTATSTELNYVDGVTSAIQTQLDGKQATITGLTSSGAELNILDGATLTTTELNYVDGVTSAIQTQLNAKAPLASPTFTGEVKIPFGTVTGSSLAATLNTQSGVVTTESLTTAAGTLVTYTITNSLVASTSGINVNICGGTSTGGHPGILKITPGTGSFTVSIKNHSGSSAFNGTLGLFFVVYNA